MFRRKLGLAIVCSLFAVAPLRAETVFTFSSWIPLTHGLNTNLYIPWAEAVEKASDGEVKIRFLPKAVAAPDEVAALLEVAPGAPLLQIERIAFSYRHEPAELRRCLCDTRAHHYRNATTG